jgi:4,5-DOPA dioxygenase extradiol
MKIADTLPTLFIGHGAPLLAVDAIKGADFRRWAANIPKPNAILICSAHWESRGPIRLGATKTLPLIYDFYGFPPELYQIQYAPPGAPWLAARVGEILSGYEVVNDETRGLDHGAWVPLIHLYPQADIPVLQISLPRDISLTELFELGKRLSPLRREGVLIIGSGALTHNLRRISLQDGVAPEGWAKDFDAWIETALTQHAVDDLCHYRQRAPKAEMNHPTDEHFTPVILALGAAGDGDITTSFPVTGFEFQNISRRCVQFD